MSRQAVAKHLAVLEEAQLVTTRIAGREKAHYLNAVPLQRIYDRWIGKYRAPLAGLLVDLKSHLERKEPMSKQRQLYTVYIRTTPEKLWQALTQADRTQHYFFKTRVESAWNKGASIQYKMPDGALAVDGEVVEAKPHTRLVQTWRIRYSPEMEKEGFSKLTWEIEKQGPMCKLTVVHDELAEKTAADVGGGWPYVLSGLKSLLETGEALPALP